MLSALFELESAIAKRWADSAHKRLFYTTWGIPPNPEFFDHHIDLYHSWLHDRTFYWLERGVFGSLAIKRNGTLLELSCGDGFNTRNFYSNIAQNIIACDFDKSAITTAKRKNNAANIEFVLADIRDKMPTGSFDNVVWDAAIEHFTTEEIVKILRDIRKRLIPQKGILSGYTIVEKLEGKSLNQHEYEFKNMTDLKNFLTPHFANVIVFETIYSERHNLYFWASDGIIPFSANWAHWQKTIKN